MATGTVVDDADARGFTYAPARRKRAATVSFATQLERVTREVDEHEWLGRVARLVESAHRDAGLGAPFGRLLCLGIGSPCESKAARAQLALLLALASSLAIPLAEAHVYEPALTAADARELAQLGLGAVSKRKARHLISADAHSAPTLLYMPHCDREVLEAFFGDNWSRARLARFVLVGNHLADYNDILPEWKFKQESPCVFSLSSRLTAWPLPPNDAVPTAFNNLAVQFLPSGTTTDLPAEDDDDAFWTLPSAAGRVAAPVEDEDDGEGPAASRQPDARASLADTDTDTRRPSPDDGLLWHGMA